MRFAVKITPHALEQISETLSYIAEKLQLPQAASNLLGKIRDELTIISEYPLSKPKVSWDELGGKYRKFLINNYVGVYSINEEEKTVFVLAFRYAPSSLGDRL